MYKELLYCGDSMDIFIVDHSSSVVPYESSIERVPVKSYRRDKQEHDERKIAPHSPFNAKLSVGGYQF